MSLKINGAPSKIATGQVTVTTTPVKIVDARPGRSALHVNGGGFTGLYFGDSNVTVGTGVNLPDLLGTGRPLESAAEIWAVAASGSFVVQYLEIYDQE